MSSSEWAVSALTTGFLAASAGLFTKAASESTAILKHACSWMPKYLKIASHLISYQCWIDEERETPSSVAVIGLKITSYSLMLACNVTMLKWFNRTLRLCNTTVVASLSVTASNIFFSALFGWLFFGEVLGLNWFAGTSLAVAGGALLISGEKSVKAKPGGKDD